MSMDPKLTMGTSYFPMVSIPERLRPVHVLPLTAHLSVDTATTRFSTGESYTTKRTVAP